MRQQNSAAPLAKPNLLERAIELVAPAWALRRHQTRATMALSGGYVGAGYSERFAHWQPGVRDADGDTLRDLRELQARSHDLVRNSPIAAGAVETQVTHVIGSGLTLQSRIDAGLLGLSDEEAAAWQTYTERRFSLWADSTYCDAADELDFYEQQDLSLRTRIESGDAFVVLAAKQRPGWPFTLALQIFEAHRCSNPNRAADSDTIAGGIERDESGAPVAVHLCDRDPYATGAKWKRIPLRGSSGRRNVLHIKRKLRPGQSRGIPELAPIIGTLKQMSRYSEAEIDAAVNSAAQAVFVKMDPLAFEQLFDDKAKDELVAGASRWDGSISSGRAVNLLPGESIESPELGRPNPNFDPFMTAFMRYVGIGLNIPAEVLSKSFQSSYSAARAALLDAWRTFQIRRVRHASKFCQPIYEEWLADEVARGAISAPGFFADPLIRAAWSRSTWSGDGPGAIDPLKEAKAMRERMDIGVTTLAEETVAYDGGDWEQKHRQRAREKAARVGGGLEPAVGVAVGAPAALPSQEEPDSPDN